LECRSGASSGIVTVVARISVIFGRFIDFRAFEPLRVWEEAVCFRLGLLGRQAWLFGSAL
jgi:hypothetical protein